MKQKTLLTIRAFVCFALTALLGFLCLCPLFTVNIKLSDETAEALIKVLENKKTLLNFEDDDSAKDIEKLDSLISKLQGAWYYQSHNLESIALDLAQMCEDGDITLPYGLKTEEDIEKWITELQEVYDKQEADEKIDEWNEKYARWYPLNKSLKNISEQEKAEVEKEANALADELFTLAKQFEPSVFSRLREDSVGYDVSLSIADIISLPIALVSRIFSASNEDSENASSNDENIYSETTAPVRAVILMGDVFTLLDLEKQLAETESESDKEAIKKSIIDYSAELSNSAYYEWITAEHFEKALMLTLLFNSSSNGNSDDVGYSDLHFIDDMITRGSEEAFDTYSATDTIALIASFIIAMLVLTITVIIAFIRTLASLFKIGKPEKFFKATSKGFEKTSTWMLLSLFVLAIGMGGQLTILGIAALIAIVFGYVVCGILSRCTTLSKDKALYLSSAQLVGLLTAIGAIVVLFSGHGFMSGMASAQTCFAKAITVNGSLEIFVVIETLLCLAQLLYICIGATLMGTGLKRFACISVKIKDVHEAKKENILAQGVFTFLIVLIPVVFSVFGMQLNAIQLLIGGILILGSAIAFTVFTKHKCSTVTSEEREILNASGRKYLDPESAVVAPFVSIEQ